MTAPNPRRRTIRFAIVAAVCLFLGVATTFGTAWWLGRPQRIEECWFNAHPMGPGNFPMVSAGHRGRFIYSNYDVPGGRWTLSQETGDSPSEGTLLGGWPMVAVRSDETRPARGWPNWPDGDPPPLSVFSWRSGISAPMWWRGASNSYLPIRPVWPGFALDTALYAAAWYLLLFTPLPLIRAGRRRFRVSRGMCGSCGYDLKASTARPCPECGA